MVYQNRQIVVRNKVRLDAAICRVRLVFWRMRNTADATIRLRYQRIGIQRRVTLRKLRPRFFNSRHFASKCHIRHNSSYGASIAMATYCFNPRRHFGGKCHALVISRDQQAKIADT